MTILKTVLRGVLQLLGLILAPALFSAHVTWATEDKDFFTSHPHDADYRSSLLPSEIHARTQSVLNYYQVPAQPSGQGDLADLAGMQSLKDLQKMLPYLDPNKMFSRLFTVTNSDLKSFDDLDGKAQLDFTVNLETLSRFVEDLRIQDLNERLSKARGTSQPLKGLRVALDPGHMGTKYWDQITGKYVRDNKGNYVSEGVIALQTSLLLKKELAALGATVELTHESLAAVSNVSYENFPVQQFARNELLESSHFPWFQKLLEKGTGASLHQAFDNSPERKKLFAPNSRYTYFVLREDLWARAAKINAFKPDIVLIVHYDTVDLPSDPQAVNPKSPNQTKVFVAGSYLATDFASRKARKQFARKLLDQTQWNLSLKLSRKIITQFQSQMGLDLTQNTGEGLRVESGIFARNLHIPRFLHAPAVAYLECLFYNRPQEFYALANTKHPLMIDGKNVPYSDRLAQVVKVLKDSVVNFAADPN